MSITVEAADALIGKVGKVRNPTKGIEWEGDYKITGYHLGTEDCDTVVTHLKAESTRTLPEQPGPDTTIIRERPAVIANSVPAEWFTAND